MKTAIISGASQGIGASIAKKLASNGYFVIINYSCNEQRALEVLNSIDCQGIIYRADVEDFQQVKEMIDYVVCCYGKIDLLVCNAGISGNGLLIDKDIQEFERVIKVNLMGTINCCKCVAENMLSNHSGNIINIASMWGEVGASCESVYSASKGGVIAFTKSLAKELGYNGIRVNCISPGVIETKMNSDLTKEDLQELKQQIPCSRLGKPEDIANAVAWLASEESSYINGQIIGINGGMVV